MPWRNSGEASIKRTSRYLGARKQVRQHTWYLMAEECWCLSQFLDECVFRFQYGGYDSRLWDIERHGNISTMALDFRFESKWTEEVGFSYMAPTDWTPRSWTIRIKAQAWGRTRPGTRPWYEETSLGAETSLKELCAYSLIRTKVIRKINCQFMSEWVSRGEYENNVEFECLTFPYSMR